MATGKRAFEGKSQIKVASSILEDDPQPVSVVQKNAPPGLVRLICSCLAKDPEERLQSALDVKLGVALVGRGAGEAVYQCIDSTMEATAAMGGGWCLVPARMRDLQTRSVVVSPALIGYTVEIAKLVRE